MDSRLRGNDSSEISPARKIKAVTFAPKYPFDALPSLGSITIMTFNATATALLGLTLCAPLTSIAADTYPTRPVRIVAPFAPGGGTDTVARAVAQHCADQFCKAFVVDNRTGASGIIAYDSSPRLRRTGIRCWSPTRPSPVCPACSNHCRTTQ